MHRSINADYYGYRDEEDGVLEAVEGKAEALMRAQLLEEWEEREAERQAALAGVRTAEGDAGAEAAAAPQFVAYVPLPAQEEIEARILESKKAQLINKYASESLLSEQQAAASLLNRR